MLVEAVLGVAVVVLLLWYTNRKPAGMPPGPWGVPLLGYVPLLDKRSFKEQLTQMRHDFGDVFVWRMGTQVMVFVNNFKLVKEAFTRPEFVDRPDWDSFKFTEVVALGIGSSNGHIWHENRRFGLRLLREMGMGKSWLVDAIHDEARELVVNLEQHVEKAQPVPLALKTSIINVIWQMTARRRFKDGDEELDKFNGLVESFGKSQAYLAALDFLSFLKIVPAFIKNKVFKYELFDNFKDIMYEYYQQVIDEHKANLDPDDPKDIVDAYLVEMANDQGNSHRSERDLILTLLDLYFAGSETTYNTLTFMIQYMAMYPKVQKKMQEEMENVIPSGSLPTFDDRLNMPYTEAVLHEVMRVTSLAPIGVQHVANQDTQLGGFFIPKGAVINGATMFIHEDPRYWDQPQLFLPERWLDEEGKFVPQKEGFLPFSVGKRFCIGEQLARTEMLIFTTAVFMNYNVSPPEGATVDYTPDPVNPMFHQPRKENVWFTKRKEAGLKVGIAG